MSHPTSWQVRDHDGRNLGTEQYICSMIHRPNKCEPFEVWVVLNQHASSRQVAVSPHFECTAPLPQLTAAVAAGLPHPLQHFARFVLCDYADDGVILQYDPLSIASVQYFRHCSLALTSPVRRETITPPANPCLESLD